MKRMKRIPLLLLTLAAVLFAASSCVENLGVGGGGINFGASAGGVLTKTAYAGYTGDDTGSGTESINWVDGDKITILCEQAKDNKSGTYSITPNSTKPTEASAVTGGGLQWGTETHYFHAAYPASNVTLSSVSTPVDGSQFTATIPVVQDGESMEYAYMYATTSGIAANSPDVVNLVFKPLVTAFHFEIKSDPDDPLPAGTKLTKVKLSSASTKLAGTFEALIPSGGSFSGTPTIGSGAADSVVVNLGGEVLSTTTPRVFTLFALPVDQKNLTLTLTFTEGGKTYTRSLKLATTSGGDITVAACEKLRVTGLAVTPTKIRSVAMQSYDPGSGFGDADFTFTVVPVSRTIRTGESFTLSAFSTSTPAPDDFTYNVNVTTGDDPISLVLNGTSLNPKSWTVTGNNLGQVVVTVKATRGSIVKEKTCTVTVVAESSTEGYGVGTGSGF